MSFYTVAEIAELLKLSTSQVYALIECGKLRVHRFTTRKKGAVRISQEQLGAYLRATEDGPIERPIEPSPPPLPLPKLKHLSLD